MNSERMRRLHAIFPDADQHLEELMLIWPDIARQFYFPVRGTTGYYLALTMLALIELDLGEERAGEAFDEFAAKLENREDRPKTALELIHFISDNIEICPIRKESQ